MPPSPPRTRAPRRRPADAHPQPRPRPHHRPQAAAPPPAPLQNRPRPLPRPYPAPPPRRRTRAVPDEHIPRPRVRHVRSRRPGTSTSTSRNAGSTRRIPRGRPGRRRPFRRRFTRRRADCDRHQGCAHRELGALRAEPGGHHAPVGTRHLHHRLGRLDLDHRLVDGHHLADLDQPVHDRRLGEALPRSGRVNSRTTAISHHVPRCGPTPTGAGRRCPESGPPPADDAVPASAAGTECRIRRHAAPEPPDGGSSAP